jgi:hypothetical protein
MCKCTGHNKTTAQQSPSQFLYLVVTNQYFFFYPTPTRYWGGPGYANVFSMALLIQLQYRQSPTGQQFWRVCIKLELSIHTVNYVHIYREDQIKPELQHTSTWSAAAWLARCLCYWQAASSCHLPVTALSTPKVKIQCVFQKHYYFSFFLP